MENLPQQILSRIDCLQGKLRREALQVSMQSKLRFPLRKERLITHLNMVIAEFGYHDHPVLILEDIHNHPRLRKPRSPINPLRLFLTSWRAPAATNLHYKQYDNNRQGGEKPWLA